MTDRDGRPRSALRRRILAAALASSALVPLGARAQAEKQRRIGLLVPGAPSQGPHNMDVLFDGLREIGYVEGRNLVIERRFGEGKPERLAAMAAELARQDIELIVAAGPAATAAARAATSTMPIVGGTHDPVEQGLVASLARPGGNLTGFGVLTAETVEKQLSLLKEAMPRLKHVGILASPSMSGHVARAGLVASSARALSITMKSWDITGPESLASAFAAMKAERVEAFVVIPDAQIDVLRSQFASLAARHRLPGIYAWRFYADAGGLMSYGPNLRTMIATWPGYIDRILKGARPGELPILTPTKYELVLNERAARELGFTFPQALRLAADEVING
jgi:putative ABC transport system substrate-binding protein